VKTGNGSACWLDEGSWLPDWGWQRRWYRSGGELAKSHGRGIRHRPADPAGSGEIRCAGSGGGQGAGLAEDLRGIPGRCAE